MMDDVTPQIRLESTQSLSDRIVGCRKCPRLVEWREQVARDKRKSYADWTYWGRAVPNFGDPSADRLIIGLAPAAHGANRTGRMFTGDRSGEWLYRALHRAGVSNRLHSDDVHDGLTLRGVMITAVCHCAPPNNKPIPDEIANCRPFLHELLVGRQWKSYLCLGSLAWRRLFLTLGEPEPAAFAHGVIATTRSGIKVVGSYHPSQQNTFTGRLTEPMLDQAIRDFLEP